MKNVLFLLVFFAANLLHAQTSITQHITANTTWSLAGSPYTLANSTIRVEANATLTIAPGVEVIFPSSNTLKIFGSLTAKGTLTDSIKFTGTPGTSNRNSIFYAGVIDVAYAVTSHMNFGFRTDQVGLSSPHNPNGPGIKITHSRFTDNNVAVINLDSGGPIGIIDSCLFEHNFTGIAGDEYLVTHSIFSKNSQGFDLVGTSTIEGCEFYDNTSYGAKFYLPIEVKNCIFQDNLQGIFLLLANYSGSSLTTSIENNDFSNNLIGLRVYRDTGQVSSQNLTIAQNKICNDSINVLYEQFVTMGPFPVLELANNCWCKWDSLGVDTTIVNIPGPPVASLNFMPIDSTCLPSFVFPGDANHDQIANNFDLLPIGIHFNQMGPLRPGANLSWTAQSCPDWTGLQANGRNVKHADTDGNGTINFDDTLAIHQNYGLTHTSWKGTAANGNYLLSFQMPTTNIFPGDTLVIPVLLGNVDTPAVGMYGLAFSINYDTMMIEPNSLTVRYDGSWLGGKNNDMLTLDKDFFLEGQVDLALVGNDQMNRTGYGKIADIIVVISDDLAKRELPLVLEFSNTFAVDSVGSTLALNTRTGISTIDTDPINSISPSFAHDLMAYPNPAKETLVLEHDSYTFTAVNLASMTGQEISLWKGQQPRKIELAIPTLTPGIYMIAVDMKEGRKILKIRIL